MQKTWGFISQHQWLKNININNQTHLKNDVLAFLCVCQWINKKLQFQPKQIQIIVMHNVVK